MVTTMLETEWQDIVSRMSVSLKSYISKFEHISEITLTWVRPERQSAPLAEESTLIVEEQQELDASRNSACSVRVVGIGSSESRPKSNDKRAGFHTPDGGQMGQPLSKPRKKRSRVVKGPID